MIPYHIAIDLMGGDFAPEEILKGVKDALSEEINFLLTGPSSLDGQLKEMNLVPPRVQLISAEEVVQMDESPSLALRKENSSIARGLELLKKNKAQAFISAGNSGAIMALSIHLLGTFPGIRRPPLTASLPGKEGTVLLCDSGANVDSPLDQLVNFAYLSSEYYKVAFSCSSPRVAVLSNGEEKNKGNKVAKELHEALSDTELNFVGNVEGNEILSSKADVIICDGFVGNIVLKALEGLAEEILKRLKNEIGRNFRNRFGGLLLRPALYNLRKQMDYQETGGAPLLGVNGWVLICHGRSRATSISSAIKQAIIGLKGNVLERLKLSFKKWNEEVRSDG